MDVVCIGAPKSGTHALYHAVGLVGSPATLLHDPSARGDKTIVITREHRNVMISWVRFASPIYTKGLLLTAIRGGYGDDLEAFEATAKEPGLLHIRFENLLAEPQQTLDSIGAYLGYPVPADAAEYTICQTVTSSPGLRKDNLQVLSDWENLKWMWDAEVEEVWRRSNFS